MTHHMKTWLPMLAKILQRVCGYINKYRAQLERNIPEEHWPLLDAVLVACQALDVVVEGLLPPDA